MKKSIYILDDNDDIRDLIIHFLSEENFEVTGFSTVEDFRKAILFGNPDLVILDVMLTDGNGIDLCDELKDNRATQHIPILIMSADDKYSNAKKECETEDFINKPFDVDEFIDKVNEHLR